MEVKIKVSQYADDTTMILDGSKKSFTSALVDLELFGAISGLRLTIRKQIFFGLPFFALYPN